MIMIIIAIMITIIIIIMIGNYLPRPLLLLFNFSRAGEKVPADKTVVAGRDNWHDDDALYQDNQVMIIRGNWNDSSVSDNDHVEVLYFNKRRTIAGW